MSQEFNTDFNVHLQRDEHGIVRQILHIGNPYISLARTPQLISADYLGHFGDMLGISRDQLKNLGSSPASSIEDTPDEFRFSIEKSLFDTTTIGYTQTILGLSVWQAGLALQIKSDLFQVLGIQSTQHPDLEVQKPAAATVKRAQSMSEAELSSQLGLTGTAGKDKRALTIQQRKLIVYRYEAAKRQLNTPSNQPNRPASGPSLIGEAGPALMLPPVPKDISEGKHYVCAKVDFALPYGNVANLNWTAFVEVTTGVVLYVRPFIDNVSGYVFDIEPATTNGGPAPSSPAASLDPVRVSRTLVGLAAPVGGILSLTGDTIKISDVEDPKIAPPTVFAGVDFNFGSRTNDFAAVNAYHHCDSFFRLLDGMGFTRSAFFGGTTFPTLVDHRGLGENGNKVDAYCLGNSGGNGIGLTSFALANNSDTKNPIGIACDYRVVLHELAGHGVLYNHVNWANFGFAHSAGDSVAAILCDPGSQAPDRFLTFPWIGINRRHDHSVVVWGWSGEVATNPFRRDPTDTPTKINPNPPYDAYGYNTEQILSTTHFRFYRSIGGDSSDLNMQRFAARMAVYLIMRAIGSLTQATNPQNAAAWADALMKADLGDWTSENITGGAYSKVIRWAFEKQGLYQPAGSVLPNNNIGAPPPVDVYIDDGRGGEYDYQPVSWLCKNIWNRLHPDGGTAHETPVTNQTNYAYVKIKNRGTQKATGVVVKAFKANPAAGLSFPIDWTPMTTQQLAAADVPANNTAEIIVGPFSWTPTHVGHECIFMVVEAAGDPSNIKNIHTGNSIPEWRLVPNDNNIGQRNVYPVQGTGTSGLTSAVREFEMVLKNPHEKAATMEVSIQLPELFQSRQWRVEFLSAGGAAFRLQAGESRTVVMRLVPGADFTRDDVEQTDDRLIHFFGYAEGILVGGNSFELDPNLKVHHGPHTTGQDCQQVTGELLKCLNLDEKIHRVYIRKIQVDIEFEGGCD